MHKYFITTVIINNDDSHQIIMMNIPLRRYILYDLVSLYLDIGNVNGKDQD